MGSFHRRGYGRRAGYPDAVPTDPISGKALVYSKSNYNGEPAFYLYSVGKDRADNLATPKDQTHRDASHDLVWRGWGSARPLEWVLKLKQE